MRSNLKEIYINMNKVEMITKSKYILRKNPIFQVNEFIKSIEPNLNNKFINNLQTLKVEDECDYQNAYDYETNTVNYYEVINDEKISITEERFDELLLQYPFNSSSNWLATPKQTI